jgi:hypothetical protein
MIILGGRERPSTVAPRSKTCTTLCPAVRTLGCGSKTCSGHGCVCALFSVCVVVCRYKPCDEPNPGPRSPIRVYK